MSGRALPEGWREARLGDLLVDGAVSYGIVQPGKEDPDGIPILRVGDLSGGRVSTLNPLRVSADVSQRHQRTVLRGDEILLAVVGTPGLVARATPDVADWNVARALAVLHPDIEVVDREFLFHALRSEPVQQAFREVLNTTVQATLNLADVKSARVAVPPLRDQRAIAEVLGVLDDKIAANAKKEAAVDEYLLASFLALRASSVNSVPLASISSTVLGGTPSRARPELWDGGTVAWINSGKANERRVVSPSEMITRQALAESAAKVMPRRSTILAITGATLGQIARLEIESTGNQSLIGVWSEDSRINDWVYFAMVSGVGDLLRHASGAAQQHVNKLTVDRWLIPEPPAAGFEEWTAMARANLDVAAVACREALGLSATRDALLPALMSGRLTVRDAERVVADAT